MTTNRIISFFITLIVLLLSNTGVTIGQIFEEGKICGKLKLNNTWDSVIYMSYIPTFGDMYSMSNEMIISRTAIDSLGYFEFDISFLPKHTHLYRLHITKKGDTKTSIIIGGIDENHLFFIANRYSQISFKTASNNPPFRNVTFKNSNDNKAFQEITDLVNKTDSIASLSGASKRKFVEDKMSEELLSIADTSSNPIISLYAIYNSNFEYNYSYNSGFYKSYLEKWSNQDNAYFNAFREKLPIKSKNNNIIRNILLAFIFIAIGFVIGKFGTKGNRKIRKLSVQERKIFDLLMQGATNQEISEQYNIGISTVKSHVSSIFTKLNVKSRKEIMNIK